MLSLIYEDVGQETNEGTLNPVLAIEEDENEEHQEE
jgi:hypothetical protein